MVSRGVSLPPPSSVRASALGVGVAWLDAQKNDAHPLIGSSHQLYTTSSDMIYFAKFVSSKRILEKQVSFAEQHTARWLASRCSSANIIISGRTTCSAKWTMAQVASDRGECHKCYGGDRIDPTCFFHWPATISTASRSYVSPYIRHCGSHSHTKAGVYSNNSLSSCCMSIQAGRWNSRRPDG